MRDLEEIGQKYRCFQALSFGVGVRGCPVSVLWEKHMSHNLPDSSQLSAGARGGAERSSWTKLASYSEHPLILDWATGLWWSHDSERKQIMFPPSWCSAPERLLSGSTTLAPQLCCSPEVSRPPRSYREIGVSGLGWVRVSHVQTPQICKCWGGNGAEKEGNV